MNLFYMGETVKTLCADDNLGPVFDLVGTAIQIILIIIPIILVIYGLIDLAKAVMAGEDKEIKAAQKMLIKRLIYTVIAFLFLFIVKGAINILVPDNSEASPSEIVECLEQMFE